MNVALSYFCDKILQMKNLFLLTLAASLSLFSCQQTTESPVVETTEVIENQGLDQILTSENIETAHLALIPVLFKMKMENTENKVLLDIRTPEELAENGTIQGAVNVDYYADNFQEEMEKLDREVPVMLYCRSGGRSGQAASLLKELGFKQVYDMQGGYSAWLESDFKESNK